MFKDTKEFYKYRLAPAPSRSCLHCGRWNAHSTDADSDFLIGQCTRISNASVVGTCKAFIPVCGECGGRVRTTYPPTLWVYTLECVACGNQAYHAFEHIADHNWREKYHTNKKPVSVDE